MRILFDIANFHFIQILVFGGLGLGIFYFTYYDNGKALQQEISGLKDQIKSVQQKTEDQKKALEDVKNFEKEILAQEHVVKTFLNFIPSSLTFTDISTLLIKEAKSAGVNIELKQDAKSEKHEDSDYHILGIRLAINGAFSQILLFLSKLTDQKRILIVDNIEMKVNRQNQLVEAQLSIKAYRHQKTVEKEEEDKASAGS